MLDILSLNVLPFFCFKLFIIRMYSCSINFSWNDPCPDIGSYDIYPGLDHLFITIRGFNHNLWLR